MPTIDAQGNIHGDHDGQFQNKHQAAAGYDLTSIAMSAEPEKPKPRGRGPALTAEQAVTNMQSVHEGCCSYGPTVWQGTKAKFLVMCERNPLHGEFETSYDPHYRRGQHCPECAGNRPVAEDEALRRNTRAHGGKYDYTEWGYQGPKIKAKIICRVTGHPPFWQRPESHWNGNGCPECVGLAKWDTARLIAAASAIHEPGTLDFSQTVYVNYNTKFTVTCLASPVHGRFTKTKNELIDQEQGCPRCAFERRGASRRKPSDQFISESSEVHSNFYTYGRLGEYLNNRTKVTITCPEHGDFDQTPDAHLAGKGCPRCKASNGEKAVRRVLTAHGVTFSEEWRDHNLRDKRPLAFDFIIPDQRVLIEFDGIQHREPRTWSIDDTMDAAIERFVQIQRRDKMKDEWAAQNGWTLIRLDDEATVEADLIERGVLPGGSRDVS